MRKGITNIIGIIIAVGVLSTPTKAEVFRGVGGDAIPTPAEIEYQGEHGVKVVRLMVHIDPSAVNGWGPSEYFLATQIWFQWFDYLLPFYRDQGIKVILNIPYPPGGYGNNRKFRLFNTVRAGGKKYRHWGWTYFGDVWRFLADKYKDEDVVMGFDLMNEPHNGAREIFELQENITGRIREVSDKVVFHTNRTGQCENFKDMRRSGWNNVKYTCHDYVPFTLTHQGTRANRPVRYKYPSRKFRKSQIVNSLKHVRAFARLVGNENIYIGEGAISNATDVASKLAWTRDMMEQVRPYNWTLFFMHGQEWRNSIWEPVPEVREQLKTEF